MTSHLQNVNLPVAVIGAGPGGLAASVALAEQGVDVVVIERGGNPTPEDYPTNRYDYELSTPPWSIGADEWRGPATLQRGIGIGGSTLYYQAVAQMPGQSVLADWGLDTSLIEKTHREVAEFLQIAGDVQPEHPLNPVSTHLFNVATSLGWKIKRAPVAILSQEHDGRAKCNYCGCCVYGCRNGDKGSADLTWYQRALQTKKVRFITETTVDFIELDKDKRAKALRLDNGREKSTLAVSAVVVAAGALETPFLLKNSRQTGAEDGIGNKHVGHNLIASLWSSLLVTFQQQLHGGHSGIPIDLLIEEFGDEGILLCQSRNAAGVMGPVSAARFFTKNYDKSGVRRWMAENYQKLAGLSAYAESSVDYMDGLTKIKNEKTFRKVLREDDKILMSRMQKYLRQWARESGADVLEENSSIQYPYSGAMFRSTCRMGADPALSAVTPDGSLWGHDNICISDASIIGSGIVAHPSLPIQVLGVHIGRKLAERLERS